MRPERSALGVKVIITKTFEKFISKHLSNYFIDLEDLSFSVKK
jgi:hypothetical protein